VCVYRTWPWLGTHTHTNTCCFLCSTYVVVVLFWANIVAVVVVVISACYIWKDINYFDGVQVLGFPQPPPFLTFGPTCSIPINWPTSHVTTYKIHTPPPQPEALVLRIIFISFVFLASRSYLFRYSVISALFPFPFWPTLVGTGPGCQDVGMARIQGCRDPRISTVLRARCSDTELGQS